MNENAMTDRREHGFTLIELLIVIAIILILIAIALPNFLEAQQRARVTTADAEMRGLAVALESYQTDWNRYPPQSMFEFTAAGLCVRSNRCSLRQLTTPIPYLSEIPRDIFTPDPPEPLLDNSGARYPWAGPIDERDGHAYYYWSQDSIRRDNETCADTLKMAGVRFVLISVGPDRNADARTYQDNCTTMVGSRTRDVFWIFSPTNGTKSNGDIQRYQP